MRSSGTALHGGSTMTTTGRLTLDELAAAAHMTARNVRAYQTRGLLQAPRREGRTSVYGPEHVQRLLQVQRARDRGASLRLLRSLLDEGRDLDRLGLDSPGRAGAHTTECLERRRLPLPEALERWAVAVADDVRAALPAQVPGAFVCAATALAEQGALAPAASARLAALVADAARPVVAAAVAAARAVDADARVTAAARLGELAGSVVEELVTVAVGEAPGV